MKQPFRLKNTTDFERVRRTGKSFAHPFVVLVVRENLLDKRRIGIVAGRRVGGAVDRNRAKRLLRVAADQQLANVPYGWDALLIARQAIHDCNQEDVSAAVGDLIARAFANTKTADV